MQVTVCYAVPTVSITGGVIVVLEHANRLRARGIETFIINMGAQGNLDWFSGNKVPVYHWSGRYPKSTDVLVATGWQTAYSIHRLSLRARRYVYFVQSDESRFSPPQSLPSRLAAYSYRLPYEYLTEAKWIRTWLKDAYRQKAVYAPNALNEKIMHPVAPLAPRGKRLRVLIEGPCTVPYKGVDDSFRAVNGLPVEVWYVSSSGLPRFWHRYDRFFERVPFYHMNRIYSSCDVLLKMSTVEGFFGPPLEMMACGGTAVTTRVTGYDEYIVDGYNALTVALGDSAAARRQIKRLIDDRDLLEKLRSNGSKTASQMKWDDTIDILEDLYRRKKRPQQKFDHIFISMLDTIAESSIPAPTGIYGIVYTLRKKAFAAPLRSMTAIVKCVILFAQRIRNIIR
ncbi:MAG: glycosyltransferase family 4 protein [Spirochaetota bacterium]